MDYLSRFLQKHGKAAGDDHPRLSENIASGDAVAPQKVGAPFSEVLTKPTKQPAPGGEGGFVGFVSDPQDEPPPAHPAPAGPRWDQAAADTLIASLQANRRDLFGEVVWPEAPYARRVLFGL